MQKWIITILSITLIISCRPYYIKDKHFDCQVTNYQTDTDIKELIYRSLKRAVVTEKDIPDYILFWKKHRIYVANLYQTELMEFNDSAQWLRKASYLFPDEVPPNIRNVQFCLKSKEELQKIANKTREDFLHLSFSLIKIEDKKATVKIDNSWVTHKNSKIGYLSGGGYTAIYIKVDGSWRFNRITESWTS